MLEGDKNVRKNCWKETKMLVKIVGRRQKMLEEDKNVRTNCW